MKYPELKRYVINLKSLSQSIDSPVVVGPGSVNGNSLKVIFWQEAAAQITPETKVYLSWYHQQKDISGYNILTQTNDSPITWECTWPFQMQHEGDVICHLELVDSISISTSLNFTVHFPFSPNNGNGFVNSNDYTVFQEAVIELTTLSSQIKKQLQEQETAFQNYQTIIEQNQEIANDALKKAEEALEKISKLYAALGED